MRSNCPITCSLDILGDPWTLVVLRDVLLAGRRHFSELGVAEGIATNTLSERLRRLETHGILTVTRDPADGRRRIYQPTDRGLDLIEVIVDLAVWGLLHTEEGTAHAWILERARTDRSALIAELRAAAT
ncbi:MAG: DNA-binding HxlR family transcriptional regulator [Myxococcota bacterium]|jgi:DNA-binding HxlR family transcriptional regulator